MEPDNMRPSKDAGVAVTSTASGNRAKNSVLVAAPMINSTINYGPSKGKIPFIPLWYERLRLNFIFLIQGRL
jgi:hypothetical protein